MLGNARLVAAGHQTEDLGDLGQRKRLEKDVTCAAGQQLFLSMLPQIAAHETALDVRIDGSQDRLVVHYGRIPPAADRGRQALRHVAAGDPEEPGEFGGVRDAADRMVEAGVEDVQKSCANRRWQEARELESGVRVFDLTA